MNRTILFIIAFFIFSIMSVTADNYYADVDIFVSPDGKVTFDGTTNHPMLEGESQEYTSKKGIYWVLNLTFEGVFSNLYYELHLPENAQINYIRTPELSRIVDDKDGIIVIGTGENTNFIVLAQYSFIPFTSKKSWIYIIIPLIIASLATLVFFLFKMWQLEKTLYNLDALTERQQHIVKLLRKHKNPLTQAHIEKHTGFPKSSLSRNIDSLVKKGIVQKEAKGMSNIISFKKRK